MMSSPNAYFLQEDIRSFDAPFFNISPAEAASMDPQQRLLLEVVYESLDRAGLPLERLKGSSTSVFGGFMNDDYGRLLFEDLNNVPPFMISGCSPAMVANRISYFFDWHGPSFVLDTACSSSTTALHLAVEALRSGGCPVAVVIGSCLILSLDGYVAASQAQMLSPTGRSYMWDEAADGYARGEGVASVVLKRLSDAVRDGDHIESVIRATALNSDGRTKSLTMPNGIAQGELIRQTYARAGFDPLEPADRCQYFEAHGTGTPAGDPQEAEGMAKAFFNDDSAPDDILYAGSIKTVIGHTETTAGLAGIIKASLALQHAVIPPNLHFNTLSPKVAPYTAHLRVPTKAIPWPDLPPGAPRRASVNSFGFGGANAHVILESFDAPATEPASDMPVVLPFVFSAASEKSLKAVLQQYVTILDEQPTMDLVDLAASLMTRRSILSHRVVVTATSANNLQEQLKEKLKQDATSTITRRLHHRPKKVLGVFTGQGAQWPQMGIDMITACPQAATWLQELQYALDSLATEYKPAFTLLDELSASESSSRLNSAKVSLPVRTALQIIQVNILRTLGVEFAAVVGHSSGEIAAAYAAGWLTASDAIRIAYLRGIAACHAGVPGESGAMLAVNISWDQAQAICKEPPYKGRVVVAASNSPSNVTLSGSSELIAELEWLFESLDQSPRRLRVDTAYHSHHMIPCAGPYQEAIKACGIEALQGSKTTKWFSSVHDGRPMTGLNAEYWSDNMLQPVRFLQALTGALGCYPALDAIVEVGPHAALRGPTLQTLSAIKPDEADIPYISLSQRGLGGLDALALAVGSFWAHLRMEPASLQNFVRLFSPSRELRYLPCLPAYPFDHSNTYRAESNMSSARLHRSLPRHPLLGITSPEMGEGEWRWRNYLRVQDLEWIEDHRVQSQVVLPATGYLIMALEAAHIMADSRPLQSLEVCNLVISRAVLVPDDSVGVETLFTISNIERDDSHVAASFNCQTRANSSFRRCSSGRMKLTFGEQQASLLSSSGERTPDLQPVDQEHFYTELDKLGYGYSGLFRGLSAIQRRKDIAYGAVAPRSKDGDPSDLLIHPATLDSSLQALMAALAYPGDTQLSGLYVPTRLERTVINPAFCRGGTLHDPNDQISIEARLFEIGKAGLCGDVQLFNRSGAGFVHIEGAHLSPLTQQNYLNDWPMFTTEVWGPLLPDASLANTVDNSEGKSTLQLDNRLALLGLQDTQRGLTSEDRTRLDWHRTRYVAWMDRTLASVREGTHPLFPSNYLEGDIASLLRDHSKEANYVEVLTLLRTARYLLSWLRGKTTIMEELRRDDLLTRMYAETYDLHVMSQSLSVVVGQLAFRHPRMKILEVGAGTGSATRKVLDQIGRDYHSYTYTDISPAFFEKAQQMFAEHGDRFIYGVLDLEGDVIQQGFAEHGYDLVIASNVLHATSSLGQTMTRIRRLLKPGGRVAVMEITEPNLVAPPFIFGAFEGWWLSESDGRPWGPLISRERWGQTLVNTGFTGFETITPDEESQRFGMSIFTARAADDHILRLQNPLAVPGKKKYRDLILIGGATPVTANLLADIKPLVFPFFDCITAANSFETYSPAPDMSLAVVLVVSDIDSPYLQDITAKDLRGFQDLITVTGKLLWVATGDVRADPHLRMSQAVLRCLGCENPHAQLQHLTIRDPDTISAETVAGALMRLAHTDAGSDYNLPVCTENAEWEILLEDGLLKIPRMRPCHDMNLRWQTSRGVAASKLVDPNQTPLRVDLADGSDGGGEGQLTLISTFDRKSCNTRNDSGSDFVRIRADCATLHTIEIDGSFLYLVIGRNEQTGARVLALSTDHGSVVSTPASWYRPIPTSLPDVQEAAFLSIVSTALIAEDILRNARPSSTVLIHEAPQPLQDAVSSLAQSRGVTLRCSTSSQEASRQDPCLLYLPSGGSFRTIARLVPPAVSVFATYVPDTDETVMRIRRLLPSTKTTVYNLSGAHRAAFVHPDSHSVVSQALEAACLFSDGRPLSAVDTVSPQDISSSASKSPLTIVNWAKSNLVPAETLPASSFVHLSSHKTYLLVGMTGDLGRSVCQWLITRGARWVVLTSRCPKIDPRWVKEMASLGAHVIVMAM
jgi:acyl transferase domain-containing protein